MPLVQFRTDPAPHVFEDFVAVRDFAMVQIEQHGARHRLAAFDHDQVEGRRVKQVVYNHAAMVRPTTRAAEPALNGYTR